MNPDPPPVFKTVISELVYKPPVSLSLTGIVSAQAHRLPETTGAGNAITGNTLVAAQPIEGTV
jgi:hypothetical protein